jgi:hypothetical protein
MHRVLLETFDFSRLRAELLTGQKRDSTKCVAVSLSLSTSCQATNNPVRRVIECNDDVASVNAALCQVAHDGCKCVTDRCVGAAVTDEAAPSLQFGAIVPSLATKVIGLLSAPGISMPSRSAASPGVKCRHIMASSKISRRRFSRAGFGSRRSGGLVGQTIHTLCHSRRSLCGRHWHDLLVNPERKVIDRNKPFRSVSS